MLEQWLFQEVLTLKLTNKNNLHIQLSINHLGLHSLIIKLTQLQLTQTQLLIHQGLFLLILPTIWNWKRLIQNRYGVLQVEHHQLRRQMRTLLRIIIKEATWKKPCSQMLHPIHLQKLQSQPISKKKNWKISCFKEWIHPRKRVIAIVMKNQRPLCQQNSLQLRWICSILMRRRLRLQLLRKEVHQQAKSI